MDSSPATATPPITYPTLQVGKKSYELRITLPAMWALEDMGIDPAKLPAEFQKAVDAGKTTHLTIKLLSVMLGNMEGEEWVPAGITPEKLMRMKPSLDDWKEANEKLMQALLKAPAAPAKDQQEPPATPPVLQ